MAKLKDLIYKRKRGNTYTQLPLFILLFVFSSTLSRFTALIFRSTGIESFISTFDKIDLISVIQVDPKTL